MEFAVVAPFFVLLILGMIEIGRAVMVQQILTNASREGTRVGVLDGTSSTDVNTSVDNYLASAGITGANITIDPTEPSSAAYGAPVTVTVTIPFNQVTWVPVPKYLGGRQLTATTVMRRETVQ